MTDTQASTNVSLLSRINHWTVGAAVLALFGLGLVFHEMPRGPDRTALLDLHISIGVVAFLPILFRVFWRVREGFPAPLPGPRWQHAAAKAVHWGLMLSILGLATTGVLAGWTSPRSGLPVFGWFTIPSPFGYDWALHETLEVVHAFLSRPLLLILLIVHIGAVLKHLVIDRDRTLVRMVTGRGA